ncbi:MAG: hypothetical protein AB1938_25440 [Myxococcota bacterium]
MKSPARLLVVAVVAALAMGWLASRRAPASAPASEDPTRATLDVLAST